jgi:probable HAF family extracellular repeat protein
MMKSHIRNCLRAISVILLLLLGPALRGQSYTITDLGALSGGSAIPTKINLAGQAVGQSGKMYGVQTHAFVLSGGKLNDIGTLPGGEYSSASDVNTRGAVVGEANTATSIHAFLWDSSKGMQDLGALPNDNCSRAFGINDSDQVVGYSSGAHDPVAFLWKKNTDMTSLGTLPGGTTSEAYDINNAGVVVGTASTETGDKHAFIWTAGGGMKDLGTLPGDITSEALRINNPGAIIGSSIGPNVTHAFLWTAAAGMQNIGTLNGESTSALDLNNTGEVVGTSTASMSGHAFYWSTGTGIMDLNTLIPSSSGFVLTAAVAINNAGWILALGAVTIDRSQALQLDDTRHHAGPVHAFLLKPVGKGH